MDQSDRRVTDNPVHPGKTLDPVARPDEEPWLRDLRRLVGGLCGALDALTRAILVAALLGELGAVTVNVVARVLGVSMMWTDEVANLALSVLAFIGGAAAYRVGHHTAIQFLVGRLRPAARAFVAALMELLVVYVVVLVALSSTEVFKTEWHQLTLVLGISAAWIAAPLVISMGLIALFAVERLLGHGLRAVLPALLLLALVAGAATLAQDWIFTWMVGDVPLVLMLAGFLGCVLLGLPVAFALMASSLLYLWTSGAVPIVALAQNMSSSTSNFILLALPFFLLAGLVMERGGISLRFIRFAASLVGHLRGGLLQVEVVSMYLVSGVSGSKVADVAAVGSVLRETLRREGYKAEDSAAVLAASAAMAETIPPSVGMLVMGSVTTVSVGALFLAGLLPAAVIAVCLMVVIYLRAGRSGHEPPPRATREQILQHGIGAVLPMCMPLMLVIGIRFGIATPTEVSAFAVLFGLALSGLIYRELGWRSFIRAATDCALMAGMVLFILAAASAFSWTLTVANLPQRLAALLAIAHGNRFLFLAGSIILIIGMGCLLEGLPALLIMAPLLLPVAEKIGINPVHYAIVLLLAMGTGAFLPPIGVGFLVTCSIADTSVAAAGRAMRPFLLALVGGILLVAFVPWFTLVLPSIMGGR